MWAIGARVKCSVFAVAAFLVVWFDSTAHASDANGALASWVPPEVLVLLLTVALGLLFKQQKDTHEDTKSTLRNFGERLGKLENQQAVLLDRQERK